jgi:hypothetical protein
MSFGGVDFADYSTILPVYLRDNAAIDTGGNSITFNGKILGTGDLTIGGGGTVTFNCGAYQGGTTMTQSGTTLVKHDDAC